MSEIEIESKRESTIESPIESIDIDDFLVEVSMSGERMFVMFQGSRKLDHGQALLSHPITIRDHLPSNTKSLAVEN